MRKPKERCNSASGAVTVKDIQPEPPQLRVPLCLLVDDSSPGEEIYAQFIEAFADLVETTHVKGKITVMPYCFPESLDKALSGNRLPKLRKLVDIIRDRIAPNFDISPEILTHNPVVDLNTGGFIYPCVAEHTWSQRQDEGTLTRYIAHALRILKNVGLEANGVTSPADFGKQVEEAYARAILEAEKAVNNFSLTWYFLHVEGKSEHLEPKLSHLDKKRREAVVSIISGKGDFQSVLGDELPEKEKISQLADEYLTLDGRRGWIADLVGTRSWIVFHHHWWHRFRANRLGLEAFAEVFRRVNHIYGHRALWMKPSDIAHYFAAQHSFEVETEPEERGMLLKFRSPFRCTGFTVSLEVRTDSVEEMSLTANGKVLKKTDEVQILARGSWAVKDGRIFLCFDLDLETEIKIGKSLPD